MSQPFVPKQFEEKLNYMLHICMFAPRVYLVCRPLEVLKKAIIGWKGQIRCAKHLKNFDQVDFGSYLSTLTLLL